MTELRLSLATAADAHEFGHSKENALTTTSLDRAQEREARSARFAVLVFPLIVLAAGAAGTLFPAVALPLNPLVPYMLGIIMFGMGLTLTPVDLKLVLSMPKAVIIGCIAQFVIMPLAGLGVALLLNLDPLLVVGFVLLGSAPGGASSNIVAYLARGNVALSVAMTSVSTLLAPFLTPLLVLWLAGKYVPVEFSTMMLQILQMVIVPVLLGVLARVFAKRLVAAIMPAVPWLSVAVLALVVAGIMARSAQVVLSSALLVIVGVMLHNAVGFALGYLAARSVGIPSRERRAITVEVGMQNAGLAAALATSFEPIVALPAAIATVWHNLAGAILALIFTSGDRRRTRVQGGGN